MIEYGHRWIIEGAGAWIFSAQRELFEMANDLIPASDRFADQQNEFVFSVWCSDIENLRENFAGRFMSILAVMVLFLFAAPASASIGAWSYGGQNYPTQAAALAAMHAVSASNALLTQSAGISGMGFGTVTYKYVAPPLPWTLTSSEYCPEPFTTGNPCFATDAAAIQYYVNYFESVGGYCSVQAGTPSAWTTFQGPPDFFYYQTVTITVTSSLGGTAPPCTVVGQDGGVINWVGTATCPNFYTLSSSGCVDSNFDSITYRLFECPSNGSPSTSVGDPCDISNGDLSQIESDFSSAGLSFQRYYHSATLESSHTLGVGWTHNYAAYLVLTGGVPTGLLRPDGHHDALTSTATSGVYISLSGAAIHVQQSGTNWIATLKDGSSEIYSSSGQFLQKVAPNGQVTTLAYNASGQLSSVTVSFPQISGHLG